MSQIRNSCVARGQVAGGTETQIFIVPANRVLLLKSALAYQASSTATLLPDVPPLVEQLVTAWNTTLWALAPTGGTKLAIYQYLATTQVRIEWNGWVALNGGDSINIATDKGPLHYWLSGALLPTIP